MHVELGPEGIGDPVKYGQDVSDQVDAYMSYGPAHMKRGAARRAARTWAKLDRSVSKRLPSGRLNGHVGKVIQRDIIHNRQSRRRR